MDGISVLVEWFGVNLVRQGIISQSLARVSALNAHLVVLTASQPWRTNASNVKKENLWKTSDQLRQNVISARVDISKVRKGRLHVFHVVLGVLELKIHTHLNAKNVLAVSSKVVLEAPTAMNAKQVAIKAFLVSCRA